MSDIAGSHTNGTMEDPESSKRDIKNHMLFEVSTEAANRGNVPHSSNPQSELTIAVGGIYSVIKSKAPVTTAEYGDRYTLIGPLNRASVGSKRPETLQHS